MRRWFPRTSWEGIERILLIFGVLGAMVASSTGETAEHLVRPSRSLVETHAFFAALSTWIYGLLLAGELLAELNLKIVPKLKIDSITKLAAFLEKLLRHRAIAVLLSIAGLIAISVTGLLGGVMVYGTTADPIAPFVLKLLGITI